MMGDDINNCIITVTNGYTLEKEISHLQVVFSYGCGEVLASIPFLLRFVLSALAAMIGASNAFLEKVRPKLSVGHANEWQKLWTGD